LYLERVIQGGGQALLGRVAHGLPVRPSVAASTTLTPVALPDGLLVMRSPRLSDGPAWSAARVANRAWLERAFPAWGDDWVAEQSEVAWAQRWARLRRLAAAGRAMPFVLTLDGALVGELGVDAVDEVTGTGEISVWMVRSHGPAVVHAAMLLMIEHGFVSLPRLLSPVATSSRRGRGPGLRSVGYEIEATVPRKVGARDLVDHDMWMVHNTASVRDTTAEALRPLRGPAPTPAAHAPTPRWEMAGPSARAALREARGGVRRTRDRLAEARSSRGADADRQVTVPGTGRALVLRPATRRDPELAAAMPSDARRLAVEAGGRVHAVLGHRHDAGTGTTEVFVSTRPGSDRDVVAAGAATLLADLRPQADEARVLVVRVPSPAPTGTTLDADQLTELGLEHLATYRSDGAAVAQTNDTWGGEDVWRMPAAD
jgi:hypothetical protein